MKKLFALIVISFLVIGLQTKAASATYNSSPLIYKPVIWISITDSLPPLNTLVRTRVEVDGVITNEQKAIRKEDGWYYPSGLTQLAWIPTHWESM